mgnify:CR=1 FL=1
MPEDFETAGGGGDGGELKESAIFLRLWPEALFSKKAMKYKSLGLKDKNLKEADFKALMLEEYTFLSRPFIINGDSVFIGNSKEVVAAAIQSFE